MRLFVGLPLPETVRSALARLGGGIPGARWLDPGTYHVTLRFLGEMDEVEATDLDAALVRITAPGFALRVRGVGWFGTRRAPSTLWAGVDRSPPLAFLKDKVDRAAVAAGLAPDDRKFAPHVTLARLRNAPAHRVGAWEALNSLLDLPPVPIDSFVLFRSHLGGDGAVHEPLERYPLTPATS